MICLYSKSEVRGNTHFFGEMNLQHFLATDAFARMLFIMVYSFSDPASCEMLFHSTVT